MQWQGLVKRVRFVDPLTVPSTGESAEVRFARGAALVDTRGAEYVERRGVPLEIALAADVRFDADFEGRPAVVAALRDHENTLVSVHGRFLHSTRNENKMLTVGCGGGVIVVGKGWRAEPFVIVEGLFDALSFATCGWSAVATIGRVAPWLAEVSTNRVVWLAFDAGRPGDAEVTRWTERLSRASVKRLRPPPRCKDWNTALVKLGRDQVKRWLREHLPSDATRT